MSLWIQPKTKDHTFDYDKNQTRIFLCKAAKYLNTDRKNSAIAESTRIRKHSLHKEADCLVSLIIIWTPTSMYLTQNFIIVLCSFQSTFSSFHNRFCKPNRFVSFTCVWDTMPREMFCQLKSLFFDLTTKITCTACRWSYVWCYRFSTIVDNRRGFLCTVKWSLSFGERHSEIKLNVANFEEPD